MSKRKIVLLATALCMIAILAVGGTLAYFTDTQSATNTFTVGNVDITLTEPNWDDHGKEEAATVYPGEPLDKDPTVENTGANPCFVRIKVEGLDQFGAKGDIVYKTNYAVGALNDGWVLHTDGYFYWTQPLVVKGTESESWNAGLVSKTTPLFDQIQMPTGLTGNETATGIVVTAQAVQAQGARPGWNKPDTTDPTYPGVRQMTVEQIAAWFATCGL